MPKPHESSHDVEGQTVYLRTAGPFVDKNGRADEHGLLTTIWNFPMRGHLWKMESTVFNTNTGEFLINDERGQIYRFSIGDALYESIRAASTPISAISYVNYRNFEVIIAYENGSVILFDTESKELIGSLVPIPNTSAVSITSSLPSAPVRILRCHPTKPLVAACADDCTVRLWDLKDMKCLRTLSCPEPIVDLRFELEGDVIALALESTGVCMYRTSDCTPVLRCLLPETERRPRWTAYGTHKGPPLHKSAFSAGPSTGYLSSSKERSSLRVIMAGDNGMLYVWGAVSADIAKATVITDALLVTVVELPVQMKNAVAIVSLDDVVPAYHPGHLNVALNTVTEAQAHRIVVYSTEGRAIVVDIEAAMNNGAGSWTIVSDLEPAVLHGEAGSLTTELETFSVPVAVKSSLLDVSLSKTGPIIGGGVISRAAAAAVASASLQSSHAPPRSLIPRDGRIAGFNDYLVVIGSDGAARLIDVDAAIGAGELCGSTLRTRDPHASTRYGLYNADGSSAGRVPAPANRHVSVVSHKRRGLSEQGQSKSVYDTATDATGVIAAGGGGRDGGGVSETKSSSPSKKKGRSKSAPRSSRSNNVEAIKAHEAERANGNLFELNLLTPEEKRLNMRKLRLFLDKHGEFPDRYRTLIWRFLLRLPENSTAFADLVRRGIHPAYAALHSRFPVGELKLFTRLQSTCSSLSHWSPIFGEVPYVPQLVFPFVVVFGTDELSALECVMSILMWWGYSWHSTFPHPPAHITDNIDELLRRNDPRLYNHLQNCQVSPGLLGWQMVSTMFSEILNKSNWLKLMDFLIARFEAVEVAVLVTPVAVLQALRASLLSADNETNIVNFLQRQQDLDIFLLCQSILKIHKNTAQSSFTAVNHAPRPAHAHNDLVHGFGDTSSVAVDTNGGAQSVSKKTKRPQAAGHFGLRKTDSDFSTIAVGTNPDDDDPLGRNRIHKQLSDVEEARANIAAEFGTPVFPLPKGKYPAYDGYPKSLVDWQLKERDRALALTAELETRGEVLRQLERKIKQVEADHEHWMMRHQAASEAEVLHQRSIMEKERMHMFELRRIEEDISKKRIAALAAMESAAEEEIEFLDKVTKDTAKMVQDKESHLSEKLRLATELQKHRELAEAADRAEKEKVRRMYMRRTREEWTRNVFSTLKTREDELEAKDALLTEQWRRQDAESQAQRELRAELAKKMSEEESLGRLQDDVAMRLQKIELEREARILELERERALRLAREQADEALSASERATAAIQKKAMAEASERAAKLAEKSMKAAHRSLSSSVELIRNEAGKLVEAEKLYAMKQAEAEQQAREAALLKEWAEVHAAQMRAAMTTEQQLQEQALRLQRANILAEAGISSDPSERAVSPVGIYLKSVPATAPQPSADLLRGGDPRAAVEDLGRQILKEQRQRFDEMRGELAASVHTAAAGGGSGADRFGASDIRDDDEAYREYFSQEVPRGLDETCLPDDTGIYTDAAVAEPYAGYRYSGYIPGVGRGTATVTGTGAVRYRAAGASAAASAETTSMVTVTDEEDSELSQLQLLKDLHLTNTQRRPPNPGAGRGGRGGSEGQSPTGSSLGNDRRGQLKEEPLPPHWKAQGASQSGPLRDSRAATSSSEVGAYASVGRDSRSPNIPLFSDVAPEAHDTRAMHTYTTSSDRHAAADDVHARNQADYRKKQHDQHKQAHEEKMRTKRERQLQEQNDQRKASRTPSPAPSLQRASAPVSSTVSSRSASVSRATTPSSLDLSSRPPRHSPTSSPDATSSASASLSGHRSSRGADATSSASASLSGYRSSRGAVPVVSVGGTSQRLRRTQSSSPAPALDRSRIVIKKDSASGSGSKSGSGASSRATSPAVILDAQPKSLNKPTKVNATVSSGVPASTVSSTTIRPTSKSARSAHAQQTRQSPTTPSEEGDEDIDGDLDDSDLLERADELSAKAQAIVATLPTPSPPSTITKATTTTTTSTATAAVPKSATSDLSLLASSSVAPTAGVHRPQPTPAQQIQTQFREPEKEKKGPGTFSSPALPIPPANVPPKSILAQPSSEASSKPSRKSPITILSSNVSTISSTTDDRKPSASTPVAAVGIGISSTISSIAAARASAMEEPSVEGRRSSFPASEPKASQSDRNSRASSRSSKSTSPQGTSSDQTPSSAASVHTTEANMSSMSHPLVVPITATAAFSPSRFPSGFQSTRPQLGRSRSRSTSPSMGESRSAGIVSGTSHVPGTSSTVGVSVVSNAPLPPPAPSAAPRAQIRPQSQAPTVIVAPSKSSPPATASLTGIASGVGASGSGGGSGSSGPMSIPADPISSIRFASEKPSRPGRAAALATAVSLQTEGKVVLSATESALSQAAAAASTAPRRQERAPPTAPVRTSPPIPPASGTVQSKTLSSATGPQSSSPAAVNESEDSIDLAELLASSRKARSDIRSGAPEVLSTSGSGSGSGTATITGSSSSSGVGGVGLPGGHRSRQQEGGDDDEFSLSKIAAESIRAVQESREQNRWERKEDALLLLGQSAAYVRTASASSPVPSAPQRSTATTTSSSAGGAAAVVTSTSTTRIGTVLSHYHRSSSETFTATSTRRTITSPESAGRRRDRDTEVLDTQQEQEQEQEEWEDVGDDSEDEVDDEGSSAQWGFSDSDSGAARI